METVNPSPTPNSYWVVPDKLLAGEFPGSNYAPRARQTLNQLISANVTVFMDLTEEKEFVEYERILETESGIARRLAAYYRLPIPDGGIPTIPEMVAILDTIDTAILAGRTVYVHCLHGWGRTGTVIGCWLVRHGKSGEEAIREITELRKSLLFGAGKNSPRTPEQKQMVLDWQQNQ